MKILILALFSFATITSGLVTTTSSYAADKCEFSCDLDIVCSICQKKLNKSHPELAQAGRCGEVEAYCNQGQDTLSCAGGKKKAKYGDGKAPFDELVAFANQCKNGDTSGSTPQTEVEDDDLGDLSEEDLPDFEEIE